MIELCYFSLHQWEIKIHLLWGKFFNIPHWSRSHSTNGRLEHIGELSKSKTRVGMVWVKWLILGTIDGVLNKIDYLVKTKVIHKKARGKVQFNRFLSLSILVSLAHHLQQGGNKKINFFSFYLSAAEWIIDLENKFVWTMILIKERHHLFCLS